MAMNLKEYAQSLGIKMPSATAKAVDVEAGKAGYEKYLADVEAATAKQQKLENETWLEKMGRYLGSSGAQDTSLGLNQGFNQAVEAYKNMPDDNKPTDEWTDEERWAFGEKYASNANEAYAMAKDLNTRKANEKKQKQQESIANWSGKNLGTGLLVSAASLGINAIIGSVGYLDALAQRAAGREVEQNVILPHEIAGAMQSGVATKLNEKGGTLNENIPIIGGKGWGDVYGLGMSIGQSALGAATGGSAGTLIQFFGMAASQGVTDALSRGANGDQAIAFGTIAGAAEAITEMISVDKLLGITSSEGVQNVFKNVLKQAGEEAREEFTTAMITNIADDWIMGGKSQFYQTVNQLVASGMSIEEAKKKAWIQTIEDIAFDTISGAASGAISGGISTGKNHFNQQFLQTEKNETAKKLLTPEQNKLIEDAKQYDTTKKRASALEKKLADGKELSGYDLRMLKSQINEASRAKDVDTVRKAIVDKMKAEGVNESQAKVLGEIALNKAIGNDVSKVQDLMLKRNAAANKVYNQISAEVMESGIGDSDWAAKTPIARLRAEKKAAEQTAEPKTELDQFKADIAAKYGADTREYKINVESLEGKIEIKDGGYAYKKSSENSRIHTEGISSALTTDDIIELSAIEKIANELGIDIYVYETKVDKNGQRTYTDKTGKKLSDSGYYDPNDNSIHIDLRAGNNGEGTMLYTASHEVVHFIKENAAEHYDALEALVTKELVEGGFSMENAIEAQRKKAIENGQTLTDEQLREEVIAEACQSFLASKSAVAEIKALKSENKGLWTALKKFFTSFFNKINKLYKETPPDAPEGKYIADLHKSAKKIRDAFLEGAVEAGKKANAKTTEKTTAKEVKSQARSISKITAEMTDAERYEILKDKKITAPYYSGEVDNLIAERKEQLYEQTKQEAKKAVVSIAKALNIPKIEINFDDVNIKVQISNSNLSKSISQGATPEQLAKLLPIILPVAKNSILLERHKNRYFYDNDTTYFDNLLGAYIDGQEIVPIRFGLKHSRKATTTLYVVVNQNKISLEKLGQKNSDRGLQDASPDLTGVDSLHRSVTYSIADIIPFVKSKDLLRYLPNEMLSDEQHKAKWEAIAETIKKTDNKNDEQYAEYVAKDDERSARQMVKAAAKANGYTDVVYHGTKAFGFTEFDTEKSDDKRSLFAAGSTELAQTYSGKHGTKKLSDNKNIDGLSNEEVVKMLNAEATQSYEGAEMQTEYDIMTLKDVNNLINEAYDGIDDLQKVLEGKIKEYADKMARDFDDKDATTHRRLIEAFNLLNAFEYKRLSTPLYVLLHHTDAFEDSPKQIAELEYKIRLMNKLTDADTSNGVVVKKDLGGYGVSVLSFDKAREELKGLISSGNYALYGKPGRQLVIDAKGQTWNNIKNWIQSAYRSTKDTYVKKDDMYYRLYDSDTNEQIFHGRIEITDKNKDMSIDSIHPIMVQKANNVLSIRSEYMKTTRDIAKFAKDEGYDSIKFKNLVDNGGAGESVEAGDVYVYFNPSDLKSADTITYDENDKIIPISQRFDATKKDIRHKSRTYSPGQVAKMKADLSHQKVYTKSTAMKFVKAFAPNIKTKAFDELSNELWIGLNTYTSVDDKRAFAKDMSDMLVDRMLVDTEVKNRNWDEAVERIAYLKPAIGTIDFRAEDASELKYMLDKNYASIRSRWGYKTPSDGSFKRAYGLDEFISDLSREMPGMAHLAEMHPAEALVEVDKLYNKLKSTIKQKYESAYEDATKDQISLWKSTVESKILDVYEYYGSMSKMLQATSSTSEAVDTYLSTVPEGTEKPEKYFVDILKQMDERISFWKAEKSKTEKISRWNGIIANKALEIRDFKNGAFLNATQYHPDVFKNSIEQLTKVQWRGNISPKGVRKTFAELKQWYSMDNPMLYDKNDKENSKDLYSDDIAFYIDELSADADVEKPLTADEYPMIYEVMNHLYTIMKNYGKIFRAGRWVDAAEIAKAYIGIIDKNDKQRTVWTRAQSLYSRQFLEPMALAKQADNYNPNGFFTQTVQELRQAAIAASVGEMRLRKEYDEFVNANQKYLMNAAKETVKYRGKDIPRLHLISLYMTMKRKQSREGLALNGFEYTTKTKWWDSETVVKIPGYVSQDDQYDTELINRATEEQMRIIAENFTDTDRQYMAILESLFNEKLRKMKIERDMERQGYTNALDGYYYPIIRGGIAKNVDTAKFTDVNRATNSSFNKSTQQHAQQYLKIISADTMVNRHIKDMCKYYYISQAIENYNVLYHIDADKDNPNRNNPMSISERLKTSKIWEKDFDYFKKLVADIQGIRDNLYDTDGWRLIETLRGNYAKFALGLNVKVLFTQVSSVIAAGDVIGFGSILGINKNVGFVGTKEDIEKYCPIAAVRSYEQTVLKAMTLSDKIGKISEKMMIGISIMDDLVVRRLFAACQIEAKKRGEGEVGSEENKIAAGKILEQIIIETQQNSYATEKSSAMRSANPLWRGLTMFTADGMKIISRIHEAAGQLKAAKNSGDAVAVKKARKKLARSIAVAVSISVYLAAISTLFNWVYDRDEEDKDDKPIKKVFNFSLDVIGNFIGALPFISDLYDSIVNGFEVEDVAYDTINNVYGSLANLWKDATDMVDGKDDRGVEDLNRDLRSLLYAVGQLSGMPVRNVYNLTRGIIGIVSPKTAYQIDSKFNETSLVNDLKKSFNQGNDSKTTYIMSLIYDERLDERVSEEQSKEILRLYKKIDKKEIEGYTVIPKDIPDKIKRDGVELELSGEQKGKIVAEYSKVIPAIDKLISSSFYKSLSDKDKAYIIDYYHDKYYEAAVNNALKITDDKVVIYNAIGFSTYAKFAFVTRGIQSDKDKNGNTISGSKKEKVTEAIDKASKDENKKLIYLASLGYSLTDAQKKKLCKYLNSLSVSASNKKTLAEMCNLTYKNGKIYP